MWPYTCILTRKTNLGLIAKVFNETVRVVVLGLVEWVEGREIIQILVVLIPHVVSYTVTKRAHEYHNYYDKNIRHYVPLTYRFTC